MTLEAWGDRLSPDVPRTLRRFPLPLILAALATLAFIAYAHSDFRDAEEVWMRSIFGLATGAVFATAGVFYRESRPERRALGLALAYAVPLATLFGIDGHAVFYRTLLPAIAGFFAPLYWLATLPRLDEYDERVLTSPDFLARAVGLVGKFVLIPLLLAYAAILFLYVLQIALVWQLPQGTLGWMVLGFVTAGAGAILVLHPAFIRDSQVVSLFRRFWFWLTVLPLVLFAIAVYERIDIYGLTPERLLLVWGGLWAAGLTLAFLLRRGDIRMIPALAGLLLLAATTGPWNLENLPRVQQAFRLDALLTGRNADPSVSVPSQPVWTAEESAAARGAIAYLANDEPGRRELSRVMRLHGHDIWPDQANAGAVSAALGGLAPDGPVPMVATYVRASRSLGEQPIDVARTPLLLGDLAFWGTNAVAVGSMNLRIYDTFVSVHPLEPGAPDADPLRADLTSWIARQKDGQPIVEPWIDFTAGDTAYRFVVDEVTIVHRWEASAPVINSIRGSLFASRRFLLPP